MKKLTGHECAIPGYDFQECGTDAEGVVRSCMDGHVCLEDKRCHSTRDFQYKIWQNDYDSMLELTKTPFELFLDETVPTDPKYAIKFDTGLIESGQPVYKSMSYTASGELVKFFDGQPSKFWDFIELGQTDQTMDIAAIVTGGNSNFNGYIRAHDRPD
jgi:hypothetical protein